MKLLFLIYINRQFNIDTKTCGYTEMFCIYVHSDLRIMISEKQCICIAFKIYIEAYFL